MNAHIQKLIEQSTNVEHGADNGFDRITFDKEKFARLIISDVLTICESAGDDGLDGHYCADWITRKYE